MDARDWRNLGILWTNGWPGTALRILRGYGMRTKDGMALLSLSWGRMNDTRTEKGRIIFLRIA